jgi:hypothetical protein
MLMNLFNDIKQLFYTHPYYEQTFIVVANFLLSFPKKAYLLKDEFIERSRTMIGKNSISFNWSFIIFVRAYFLVDK